MRAARYVAFGCVALGATMCGGKEKGGDTSGAGTGSGDVGSGPTSGGVTSTSGVGGSVSTSSTGSVVVGTGGTVPTTPDPAGVGGAGGANIGVGGAVGVGGARPMTGVGGTTGFGGTTGVGGPASCNPPYPAPVAAPSANISDFEGDATEPTRAIIPGPRWSMDKDGSGTGSIALEPCGTTGQGLHAIGSGFNNWGADVAAALVTQVQPVDASRFGGISFVLRSASPVPVYVKLQVPYSQPACGRCLEVLAPAGEECYSGYIKIAQATSSAVPQVVRFTELAQQSWGYRPPGTAVIDAGNLISIAFAIDKGIDFDICVDDIKFVP